MWIIAYLSSLKVSVDEKCDHVTCGWAPCAAPVHSEREQCVWADVSHDLSVVQGGVGGGGESGGDGGQRLRLDLRLRQGRQRLLEAGERRLHLPDLSAGQHGPEQGTQFALPRRRRETIMAAISSSQRWREKDVRWLKE